MCMSLFQSLGLKGSTSQLLPYISLIFSDNVFRSEIDQLFSSWMRNDTEQQVLQMSRKLSSCKGTERQQKQYKKAANTKGRLLMYLWSRKIRLLYHLSFCQDLNFPLVSILNLKKMKIWNQLCWESSQDQICFQCLWGEGEGKLQPTTWKIVAFLKHKLDPGMFTVFKHCLDVFTNWFPYRDGAECNNWGEADKVLQKRGLPLATGMSETS